MLADGNHRLILSHLLIFIREIRSLHLARVPGKGETRTDKALSIERLRHYSEEALDESAGRNAYIITEITIAFTSRSIVIVYLSEVGWKLLNLRVVTAGSGDGCNH